VFNAKVTSALLIFGLAIMLPGCAEHSLKVLPDIGELPKKAVCITCKLQYDGNHEYLPSYLVNNQTSTTTASYSYDVKYVNGNTNWDGLNLFNPLLIVGFPLSEESVIVQGTLKIQDGLSEPHVYTSSCIANKTRSLYQNSGSSAPRKACLYAVRDNINSQLIQYKQEEKK